MITSMQNDYRVEIDKTFKKKIFTHLLNKYTRKELSKFLSVTSSMLYHYKNNRVNNLSQTQWEKCLKIAHLNYEENKKYVLKRFSLKKNIGIILKKGAKHRHNQLKEMRESIPCIDKLIEREEINLEKWFLSYQDLLQVGPRRIIKIKKTKDDLFVTFTNYSRGEKKEFTTIIPRRIRMDDEFCYFLGLWCGDRAGGGRLGVLNTEKSLNDFTYYYLKKLKQKPIIVILKSSRMRTLPKVDFKFDAVQEVKGMAGTYVPMVFALNGILKTFFFHLDKQLDELLSIIPNQNAFFAGLFDAEGNVFLEDSCFRWSCKNEQKVEIYKKYLNKKKLFKRYDGCNLICNNQNSFKKFIFPYLKHPQKINDTNLVCFGIGKLNKRFLNILNTIKHHNGSNMRNMAKALKMARVYSQIKVLERLGYIITEGYPKMIFINEKGLAALSQGGKDI